MKTAREALREHQEKFWQCGPTMREIDLYMATECQLQAQAIREVAADGYDLLQAKYYDNQARYYLGVKTSDQLYS